jgi:hypothetical protein
MHMRKQTLKTLLAGALTGAWLITPQLARAHCDGLDGPVVTAAKKALAEGNVNRVLCRVAFKVGKSVRSKLESRARLRHQDASLKNEGWIYRIGTDTGRASPAGVGQFGFRLTRRQVAFSCVASLFGCSAKRSQTACQDAQRTARTNLGGSLFQF